MRKSTVQIALVVMASGYGKRYGRNKLLELFQDRPLYQYGMDVAAGSGADAVIVVTRFPEIKCYIEATYPDVQVIWNEHPEHGISESLRLGLTAAGDMEGCCFMVSDQPLFREESMHRLFRQFQEMPSHILVCCDGNKRGNPAIFPRHLFGELLQLTGDQGGRQVMLRHEDLLREVLVSSEELMDIDRVTDIQMLESKMRNANRNKGK